MKILIRPFSEINVKSPSVKSLFIHRLKKNIAIALKEKSIKASLESHWDKIILNCESIEEPLIDLLKNTIGIDSFSPIHEGDFLNFESLADYIVQNFKDQIQNKSFSVRVKRIENDSFKSMELEKYLGGAIRNRISDVKVKLIDPEIEINVIVKKSSFSIYLEKIYGKKGFPIGTQGKVLSMISGGFDSVLSSYQMMLKGNKLDFLFFKLGGSYHQDKVLDIAYKLANKYGTGYHSKFMSVDFSQIMPQIMKIHHKYRTVILKRSMIKVANILMKEAGYNALVTGESIGQVSSQTIKNLQVIDEASNNLIIRPLSAFSKVEIIKKVIELGFNKSVSQVPEYCALLSDKPGTACILEWTKEAEKIIDESELLELAHEKENFFLKHKPKTNNLKLEQISKESKDDVVLFISHDETLSLTNKRVIHPDKFISEIKNLNLEDSYLIQCETGSLSEIYALEMLKQGFNKVKKLI